MAVKVNEKEGHVNSLKPLNAGVDENDLAKFHTFAKGYYRQVKRAEEFPGIVVKVVQESKWGEYFSYPNEKHQRHEVQVWQAMVEAGDDDLVPSHDILLTESGIVIVVEEVRFQHRPIEWHLDAVKRLGQWTPDVQWNINSGVTWDGRTLLLDAGADFEDYESTEYYDSYYDK